MSDRDPSPYREDYSQRIRKTGLTVDYLNGLGGLAINLTTWRLKQFGKLGYTEADIKSKIVELCKKVKKYEERYAGSSMLDSITVENRPLVDAIDQH